jgi:hypothetical protein
LRRFRMNNTMKIRIERAKQTKNHAQWHSRPLQPPRGRHSV